MKNQAAKRVLVPVAQYFVSLKKPHGKANFNRKSIWKERNQSKVDNVYLCQMGLATGSRQAEALGQATTHHPLGIFSPDPSPEPNRSRDTWDTSGLPCTKSSPRNGLPALNPPAPLLQVFRKQEAKVQTKNPYFFRATSGAVRNPVC